MFRKNNLQQVSIFSFKLFLFAPAKKMVRGEKGVFQGFLISARSLLYFSK
jgi:hypothetical protein